MSTLRAFIYVACFPDDSEEGMVQFAHTFLSAFDEQDALDKGGRWFDIAHDPALINDYVIELPEAR